MNKSLFDRILQSQRTLANHIVESHQTHMEIDQDQASQEQINTSSKQD